MGRGNANRAVDLRLNGPLYSAMTFMLGENETTSETDIRYFPVYKRKVTKNGNNNNRRSSVPLLPSAL